MHQLRFYYNIGSSTNTLKVRVLKEDDGSVIEVDTISSPTSESWLRREVSLASFTGSFGAFAIEFVGTTTMNSNGFAAIDDITLSPDCLHNDETVCLRPDYYRCQPGPGETVGKCLKSVYVGDFFADW